MALALLYLGIGSCFAAVLVVALLRPAERKSPAGLAKDRRMRRLGFVFLGVALVLLMLRFSMYR